MADSDLQFNLEDRSPFNRHFRISKGALLPKLIVQLLDGVDVVVLTTGTVKFSMDDEAGVAKIDAVAATLESGSTGKVSYQWLTTDTNTEGTFFGQFEVTISGNTHLIPNNDSQRLVITIGPKVN